MRKLKICFSGIGSIARRHIRNLRFICQERGSEIQIDAFRHSISSQEVGGIDETFYCMEDVPDDYDAIFVTNPTECHLDTLKAFHKKGRNFFIEKPVVSLRQVEEARRFQQRKGVAYYVACPLRYHAVIRYIKENVSPGDVISVRSISSSYLPDWRPGQDYRETYSAHEELGGGVGIDLIHEWDYLTYLFGKPDRVSCFAGKKSPLEISSDDYAVYIAESEGMVEELHLDYFGRKTIREIQLFMKDDTVVGDIANHKIRFLVSGKEIEFHEGRDDYHRRELQYFLDMVWGVRNPENHFGNGIDILELTQGKIG